MSSLKRKEIIITYLIKKEKEKKYKDFFMVIAMPWSKSRLQSFILEALKILLAKIKQSMCKKICIIIMIFPRCLIISAHKLNK